jgi:predicted dehydrogenase
MNILIIGLGSIANKHIQALRKIDSEVYIEALRSSEMAEKTDAIKNIFSLKEATKPDLIIVSNPSIFHFDSLIQILPFNVPILLEKPAFTSIKEYNDIEKHLKKFRSFIQVGFNLRHLKCLQFAKDFIVQDKLQEVNVYAGSYLPDWRPQTNYKDSYSAKSKLGGGVHLDLIHELDYTTWICGFPDQAFKSLRSKSHLGIESIDFAHYLLEYPSFATSITLNYYRKDSKREIEFITNENTIKVDILKNSVTELNSNSIIFESDQTILDTYTDQMNDLVDKIKSGYKGYLDLKHSMYTLKIAINGES